MSWDQITCPHCHWIFTANLTDQLQKDLVLLYDTAKHYHETTGEDFYLLSPTEQRKLLEEMDEKRQEATKLSTSGT
jgi:hypothetical protein